MQLAHCPEASTHLQEMKDQLIMIANELLDNMDLSTRQMEDLREKRFAIVLLIWYKCQIDELASLDILLHLFLFFIFLSECI